MPHGGPDLLEIKEKNMAKVSIPQFIHYIPKLNWQVGQADVVDGMKFTAFPFKDMSAAGYSLVGPGTIEFDLPDNFDPRGQQIAAMVKQREKLQQEFAESVERINRTISELTAIEYTP